MGLRRSLVELPKGVHAVTADLTVSEQLERLPTAIDAVVYIAAADAYDDQAYEAAYVRGPANLIGR